MKKNKTTRLAILLLALAMVTMMLVAGTYAKYTSSATGTATASVAKWSITLAGQQIATSTPQTVNINLFSTILDSDLTTTEGDVATGLIAPGTSGTFDLAIANTSEVNAEYTLSATISNSTPAIPIEFKVGDGEWGSSISAINTADPVALNMNSSDTITVSWRWAYTRGTGDTLTANDAADTALGITAQGTAPSVTVSITVTATQVD